MKDKADTESMDLQEKELTNLMGKTVYLVDDKYHLTTGIISNIDDSKNLVLLQRDRYYQWLDKKSCLTEEAAKAQAKILRDKKIKSVEKQLTKLKSMEF